MQVHSCSDKIQKNKIEISRERECYAHTLICIYVNFLTWMCLCEIKQSIKTPAWIDNVSYGYMCVAMMLSAHHASIYSNKYHRPFPIYPESNESL